MKRLAEWYYSSNKIGKLLVVLTLSTASSFALLMMLLITLLLSSLNLLGLVVFHLMVTAFILLTAITLYPKGRD